MAVVKADAYGHGAVPVSRAALEAGADSLAVVTVEEGAELRRAGIRGPDTGLHRSPAGQAAVSPRSFDSPSRRTRSRARVASPPAPAWKRT